MSNKLTIFPVFIKYGDSGSPNSPRESQELMKQGLTSISLPSMLQQLSGDKTAPREFTKLSPSTKLREKDFRTHMFTKLSCCCHPHHQSLCGFCPPEQQQGVTIRQCCTHQHLSCSFSPPPPPQKQGQLFSRCLRLCSSLKRRTE